MITFAYDAERCVITINGKDYAAHIFGPNGFCAEPGSVFSIAEGPDHLVTLHAYHDATPELVERAGGLLKLVETMVGRMDRGAEPGAGSPWHEQAVSVLRAIKGGRS